MESAKMSEFDMIFECDYGNRTPVKEILKELLNKYDPNLLPMVAVFINNNPYSLELFVALSFTDQDLKEVIYKKFLNIGAKLRTDLTLNDLIALQLEKRQFNSYTLLDANFCELIFNTQFFFPEKKDLEEKEYATEPTEAKFFVFVSYSCKDEKEIEQLIPMLNRKNVPIWYDKHCIDYGESLTEKIQNAIKSSAAVIFWITKNFLNSSWCKTEMNTFLNRFASKRDILILTVKDKEVHHEELPEFLKDIKYLDRGNKTLLEIAEELLPVINRHLRKIT